MTAVIIIVIAYLSLFLYRNFYQTITQTKIITVLSSEVAWQDIAIDKFYAVLKINQFKQKSILISPIANPFAIPAPLPPASAE